MTQKLEHEPQNEPSDLLPITEVCLKHCLKYDYLYKLSVIDKVIKLYFRGVWKLSESEVLQFCEAIKEKKLSQIKSWKGGE